MSRKLERSFDILFREVGKIFKNIFLRHAGGEVVQNVVDCNSHPTDARFSASLAFFDCYDVSVIGHG